MVNYSGGQYLGHRGNRGTHHDQIPDSLGSSAIFLAIFAIRHLEPLS